MKTIFDELLCAGFGMYDTKKGTGEDYEQVTVLDVLTRHPTTVPKSSASWALPSSYSKHDARSHDVQRARGKFCLLSADIDNGNRSLSEIDDAIAFVIGVDALRRIYSTSSSKADNKKWRIVIPVHSPLSYSEWHIWERCLNAGLDKAGLVTDKVMERSAQPIFLPNTKADSFYENALLGSDELNTECSAIWNNSLNEFRELLEEEQRRDKHLQAMKPPKRQIEGSRSVIDLFNATYSIEQLLGEYGYKQKDKSDSWRSPNQSSDSFATKNFGDYWVSLSGSDANAGLGVPNQFGCSGDAFSLYCFYEHGGDALKAVKELLK